MISKSGYPGRHIAWYACWMGSVDRHVGEPVRSGRLSDGPPRP